MRLITDVGFKLTVMGNLWSARYSFLRVLAALPLGAAIAAFFLHSVWLFDLFNAFLPQMLLGGTVLFVIAILLKDRWSAGLAALAIMLNLTAFGSRVAEIPAAPRADSVAAGARAPVKLMFANLLRTNHQYGALLDMVAEVDPDIFVAAEVGPRWETNLLPLHPEYPHRVIVSRTDNFGLAVFSRLPFSEEKAVVSGELFPMFAIPFDQGFTLVAAHPPPPVGTLIAKMQQDYLMEMRELIAKAQGPIVVAGDLNATLWSHSLSPLKGLGLERADADLLGWTWPAGFLPMAVQIDHVLIRGAQVDYAKTLEDFGSDHYPIVAKLHFSLPSSQ